MRRLGLTIVVALSILIQVSLLPAIRPLGVVPSLMLPVVVLIGLEGTATVALAAAVVGGVALDLASSTNFGMWTAILVLAALTAGLLRRAGFELAGPIIAIVMVTAGTILSTLVILMGLVTEATSWPVGVIAAKFLSELVINLLLTILARPLIKRLVDNPETGARAVG
jgi:rod shape-determining protein MreD